uniref:Si:ch211-13k12.2 n=1 Tax=Oryzias sinensis TaxID=183150 RepID=A0A8C7Y3P8_9TELE
MASLRELRRYGLSCGENNRTRSNSTLYHVKLTDTAIRALEAFQNLKGALQSQPIICFKGNQGLRVLPPILPERGGSAMASSCGAVQAGTKEGLFFRGLLLRLQRMWKQWSAWDLHPDPTFYSKLAGNINPVHQRHSLCFCSKL